MGRINWGVDHAVEAEAESRTPEASNGFERMKDVIADTLQSVAGGLNEKTADMDAQSGMTQYGKQASEWMEHSAEYVRQFDYKEADAGVRAYIRQNPGRSLLIAGGVGLMLGAILRRR